MKQDVKHFATIAYNFLRSDAFIAFNAVVVLLGWCFDVWQILLPILCAVNFLPLFFSKDTKHLLCIFMFFSLMISTNRHELSAYAPMLVIVIVLIVGMAVNAAIFKRNFKLLAPSKVKTFHASLYGIILPIAFAGVTVKATSALARIAVLALFLAFAVGYSFMWMTSKEDEDRSAYAEYLLKVLVAMGLVIMIQCVVYFAKLGSKEAIVEAIKLKTIMLGWAGPNNVAPTLSICIPATLYFIIRKNKFTPVFTLVAMLEYLLLFATGSRGAILFSTLAMPAMILYVMAKTSNKASFAISLTVIFAIGTILIAYYGRAVVDILSAMLNKGLSSSGRTEWLYPEAFDVFKRFPVFGSGWDFRLGEMAEDGYSPYWYHSTLLQVLATMGVVGILAFLCFYIARYRTFLTLRRNSQAMALFMGTLLFDAYGMIDTNFFGPSFFLMLTCMTFVTELLLPDEKCLAFFGHDPIKWMTEKSKHIALFVKTTLKSKHAPATGYYPESALSDSVPTDAPSDDTPAANSEETPECSTVKSPDANSAETPDDTSLSKHSNERMDKK